MGNNMSVYNGKIESYQLKLETANVHTKYKRVIYLSGDFGKAYIYFVPEGSYLSANKKIVDKEIFHVYFWEHNWESIIDILRYEKLIGFYFSRENNEAIIYTGEEPFTVDESS